jgi:hypothetical protein
MSLDNIVNITISTNSLQVAQTGFGIPLIIANHELWDDRVRIFSYLSEIPAEEKEEKKAEPEKTDPAKAVPDTPIVAASETARGPTESKPAEPKETVFPKLDIKSELYLTIQSLLAQNPKVTKFKIGQRKKGESIKVALNAIIDEDADFYGVLLVNEDTKNPTKYHLDVTELAEAVSTKRLLVGVDLYPGEKNANLDGFVKALNKSTRVFAMYKANAKDYPAAALMGKMLSQAPGSASWAFKQLEGVSKAQLSTNTIDKLQKANINRYINIKDVGVTLDGRVAQGEYIDIIHGIDWLHVRIQERLFRLLMVNPKIPFTLQGVDLVRSEIMAQLKEAVYRGLLAADPEPMVSIPNIEDIDPGTRGKRILPDVRFSARLAGAIHHIEIQGKVTT